MQPRKILFQLLLALLLVCGFGPWDPGSAQDFQLMRYDEDYRYFRDSSGSFYNRLKYLPLTSEGKLSANGWVYLSFGGGVRWELDAFDNEDWGQFDAGKDNFFLQRYDFHADFHLGDRVRVYAELRSALENGRPHAPRPIDEDKLNMENCFFDVRIREAASDTLTFRGGRQEINYGSGRLISVRDGPNLRLYFTGAKLMYVRKDLSVDAFAMEADSVYTSYFDNKGTRELNLWGSYASLAVPVLQHVDCYYIGIRRDNAPFEEGTENEVRHTFGSRIWRTGNGFNYDLEGGYQLGRFGTGDIRAWAAFFDVSYLFGRLQCAPQVGIRNDYMSGDKKAGDGSLQSFNPIYPKAGYFSGFDPQVGAVNLIDLHPYFALLPFPNFTFNLDVAFNWRYAKGDGVYRPNGVLHLPGTPAAARYIGTGCLIKVGYNINSYVNLNFGAQLFDIGPFIDEAFAGAKSALLTNSQLVFKF
jgi:hypothetical protein